MNNNRVIRFPVARKQRKINEMGKGYVPCEVSERWLQFPEESTPTDRGEFMTVDVMTKNSDEVTKRLCTLIITREDIMRALENIKPRQG